MTDTAETLRRAVKLLRERAEAATPGPWIAVGQNDDWYVSSPPFGLVSTGIHEDHPSVSDHVLIERDRRDAEYIAMMDPVVAKALADWLDDEAEWAETVPSHKHFPYLDRAMNVARACLAEQAR